MVYGNQELPTVKQRDIMLCGIAVSLPREYSVFDMPPFDRR